MLMASLSFTDPDSSSASYTEVSFLSAEEVVVPLSPATRAEASHVAALLGAIVALFALTY